MKKCFWRKYFNTQTFLICSGSIPCSFEIFLDCRIVKSKGYVRQGFILASMAIYISYIEFSVIAPWCILVNPHCYPSVADNSFLHYSHCFQAVISKTDLPTALDCGSIFFCWLSAVGCSQILEALSGPCVCLPLSQSQQQFQILLMLSISVFFDTFLFLLLLHISDF